MTTATSTRRQPETINSLETLCAWLSQCWRSIGSDHDFILGTLRSTTSFKQKNSSFKIRRMSNFNSPEHSQHRHRSAYVTRLLSRLKKDVSSRREKSCYLRLNSTWDYSRFRRTKRFRSHKTGRKCQALWSINRGFFKCWNFKWRRR